MTEKPENYEELTRLTAQLLEGQLSEPERARLQALLQADPRARRLYLQMIDQEVELSCLLVPAGAQGGRSEKVLPLIPSPAEPVASSLGKWRPWRLAAAAAILVIGTALALVVWRNPFGQKTVGVSKPPIEQSSLHETWSEDFESGAAPGWHGRIVATNLPAGSKFGIAAVVREYPGAEPSFNIHVPEDWTRGLVALTTGSTLNVTYRLGHRTHVNVFMHTISPEKEGREYEMYQLRSGGGFPGRSGRWQTAAIPFSSFVRKIVVKPGGAPTFLGGPPRAGEPLTALSFSSMEPSDLVIDRIWITPTGPAREEIVPVRTLLFP